MTLVFLVLLEELCFTMQLGRVLLLVRDNFIVSSIVCVNFFNLSRGIGGVYQTMQVAGRKLVVIGEEVRDYHFFP